MRGPALAKRATVRPKRKARRRQPPRAAAEAPTGGPVSLATAQRIARARVGPRRGPKRALATVTAAEVAQQRRRLALRQRADLAERIRFYEATYDVLRARGVQGLPRMAKRRTAEAGPPPLRILAEGDSWFDFPAIFGSGLVPRLEKRLGLPILNAAEAGDEVRSMLGVAQREKLVALLRRATDRGEPWDLLLFSGGGNDIVSDPLCLWLRPWQAGVAPAKLLHDARFAAALAIVRAGYEDLLAIRDEHSPGTRLVFHGYDFALPSGVGVCHLGPWLKPSFDHRAFPAAMAPRAAVVREMLLRFRALLADLAAAHSGVTVVDTQGTLDAHPGWWHDELHPSRPGFDAFAALFVEALRKLHPDRIP